MYEDGWTVELKVLGLHTLLAVMAKLRLEDQSYGHFTSSVLARLVFCEMLHGRLSRSQAPSEPCAPFTSSLLYAASYEPTNHQQLYYRFLW
jgi:hypothetical protein